MADNVLITAGVGTSVSTEEITTLNGGAVSAQHVQRMVAALRTADGIASDLPGDTANGLDVDVTRLPALAAGTNNIGDVDILSIAAGDNNIGNVDIVTLPALVAGTANIGDVDVLTLPALPAGANVIGALTANQSVNQAQVAGTATSVNSGNKDAGTQRVVIATDQPTIPVSVAAATATYRGRVSTFRTPGRAGTAGQKIFALHNATASAVVVTINSITVDMVATVVKLVTVLPPAVRIYRVTVLPTNGTAGTKVARDTSLTSSASVTVFQDAQADGTSSASALTATLPAGNVLAGVFASRLITAAGFEPFDRETFLENAEVTLRALEGIVVMLDYPLATQNPITDMWLVTCEWDEV